MADEIDKKHLNDSGDTRPPVAADRAADVRLDTSSPQNVAPNRRGLIIGLVVIAVLVLGLLGVAGFAVFNGTQQRLSNGNESGFTGRSSMMYRGSGFGRGGTVQTEVSDGTVTTTVYNYLTGVVVAVNSDNIVVAGNGKQTTVKTNSSTSYVGNVKPVVNDTVTIAGTTADSVITATEINVANG